MREIKFEVWDCYNKEMHENLTIASPFWTDGSYQEVYCKIRQYTGLKHSDNSEMFENDLVNIYGVGACKVGIDPVLGTTFTALADGSVIESANVLAENDLGACLGNIYENPELLEE